MALLLHCGAVLLHSGAVCYTVALLLLHCGVPLSPDTARVLYVCAHGAASERTDCVRTLPSPRKLRNKEAN